jgi:CRP/FNR family transcriptional regulator, cyclic AMP receptor protein
MTDKSFDYSQLEMIGFPTGSYAADEWIFMAEDAGKHMFIVRSGEVQIINNGSVLEVVGQHGVFGEMSLIDGAPRAASAKTTTSTELVAIDRPSFLRLVQSNPEFSLQIMRSMATRIRQLTETI